MINSQRSTCRGRKAENRPFRVRDKVLEGSTPKFGDTGILLIMLDIVTDYSIGTVGLGPGFSGGHNPRGRR